MPKPTPSDTTTSDDAVLPPPEPVRFLEQGPLRLAGALMVIFVIPFLWFLYFDPPTLAFGVSGLRFSAALCTLGAISCTYRRETDCDPVKARFQHRLSVLALPVWARRARFEEIKAVEIALETTWGDEGGLDAPRLVLRVTHTLTVVTADRRLRFRRGWVEATQPMEGEQLLAWLEDHDALDFLWDARRLAKVIGCRVTAVGGGWDHLNPANVKLESLHELSARSRGKRVKQRRRRAAPQPS